MRWHGENSPHYWPLGFSTKSEKRLKNRRLKRWKPIVS